MDEFEPKSSKFLPGLLLGVLLGGGGVFAWFQMQPRPTPPEFATVGPATMTSGKIKKKPAKKVASNTKTNTPTNTPNTNTPANNPSAGDLSAPPVEAPPQEEIPQITAADLKIEADGDVLRPRTLTIDAESEEEPRDLTQSEVDGTFASVKPQIVQCIKEARGAAPVSGKITVGVVIGPDGKVFKSRVEGPAYLMDQGLYGCIKGTVTPLRFPAPGKDIVATIPFTIK
jgi:hypothetical protein